MSETGIRALLQEQMGLDPASLGTEVIDRAVRDRMAVCKLTDTEVYEERLRKTNELQSLIDAVIVPETWFFRDGEPFRLLQQHAINTWWPKHPGGKFRVLSIPCSTGEEPYTVAMALMDGGLSPLSFSIDGVDISTRSLEKAKRAAYGSNSFRGSELSFRERYFKKSGTEFQLDDTVRKAVNFIHGNLLDPLFLADRESYDVVFCRNLLIYFDTRARQGAARALFRLLKKDGLLFVGHAEALEMFTPIFESVRHPHAFAYRLKRNVTRQKIVAPDVLKAIPNAIGRFDQAKKSPTTKFRMAPLKPLPTKDVLPKKTESEKPEAKTALLVTARQLADQGKLQEAMTACESYLIKNPADAEAHCLRGVLAEAQGNRSRAEDSFNRALYLKNDYQEAMVHLILLLESKGDHERAKVLRERAARLKSKT
jgi:chemotaxis protein methyltransferase WspC